MRNAGGVVMTVNRFQRWWLAAGLLLSGAFVGAPVTEAALINGGFETGDFTGWSTIGEVSIETAAFGSGPTEGTYEAFLSTGGLASPVSVGDLETFLGLASGTLDGISPSGLEVVEGSAIKQTFSANAGDLLSFDWNFLTDELDAGDDIDDFSFVTINPTDVLASIFDASLSSSTPFVDETGFGLGPFTFVIPATGMYTLGIGVVDVDDEMVNSGLLVDDVRLTNAESPVIPEPTSLLLFGLGGLGAGCAHRRKRIV